MIQRISAVICLVLELSMFHVKEETGRKITGSISFPVCGDGKSTECPRFLLLPKVMHQLFNNEKYHKMYNKRRL